MADWAQFSTSVTELGDPAYAGTALTTQVALGFLPTLGPALGSVAMWRLRSRPEARRMAGGMR